MSVTKWCIQWLMLFENQVFSFNTESRSMEALPAYYFFFYFSSLLEYKLSLIDHSLLLHSQAPPSEANSFHWLHYSSMTVMRYPSPARPSYRWNSLAWPSDVPATLWLHDLEELCDLVLASSGSGIGPRWTLCACLLDRHSPKFSAHCFVAHGLICWHQLSTKCTATSLTGKSSHHDQSLQNLG